MKHWTEISKWKSEKLKWKLFSLSPLFHAFFFFSSYGAGQQQKEQTEGEQQRWILNGKLNLKNRKHGEFPEENKTTTSKTLAGRRWGNSLPMMPRKFSYREKLLFVFIHVNGKKACGLNGNAPNHQKLRAFSQDTNDLPGIYSQDLTHSINCIDGISWLRERAELFQGQQMRIFLFWRLFYLSFFSPHFLGV